MIIAGSHGAGNYGMCLVSKRFGLALNHNSGTPKKNGS